MQIFGLSGVARCGKDSFCKILQQILFKKDIQRFALADNLKIDLYAFLKQKCNINIFSCSIEDKELIRPILVEYGRIKRKQTNGQYWTKLLEAQIEKSQSEIGIITDIRYDVYPYDELHWLKNTMKGTLIHISRYNLVNEEKQYISAPNKDEAENDPKIKAQSDYKIEWQSASSIDKIDIELRHHVEDFVNYYKL